MSITDRDRYNLARAIDCVLLQNTTRETHKFTGRLENSRMILLSFCLINQTEYRTHTGLT